MKLCVFLILVTATSVIADGHADICSSQFNWWYGVANNAQPKDSEETKEYGLETAEEKIRRLTKAAYSKFGYSESEMPIPTMCEMQQNANGYYHHWEKVLREINDLTEDAYAPGFGFPFQASTGKTYTGLAATCVKEDSIQGGYITAINLSSAGGPAASCAYGYPGSAAAVQTASHKEALKSEQFDNVRSTCRLKILGFEENQDLELQWCITDILGSMQVGKAGGYYDGHNSKTPDLKCNVHTSFYDASPYAGTSINPPYAGTPYPTRDLKGTLLGPNPLPEDELEEKQTVYVCFKNQTVTNYKNEPDKKLYEYTINKKPLLVTQRSPNDPYQSFPILFRQMADQKVTGMCSVCEECVYSIFNNYGYPEPEEFCTIIGRCSSSFKSKSSKKKSKNNHKNVIIMI
mmetsp:Transcript_33415/g.37350  ORF Transcript_33415/g.37350 Transcript_33415/m.37350 type:complete len:404 (+) Transcript_33415:186-1397(+)|eukprot:CAMPEP_0170762994 /NCGR_PEP_ID=MMETSP0733-20121128/3107_1 /TAXON_ID=186038 /ORGANISM="Fragilariopsis kerguelensis, Strain L26-C5" /LENGTH=403 /DNA_ID=CAMNT_0011103293 /DNA_START=413 /DNA_END=1624 /DNA_ORIENTATION=+